MLREGYGAISPAFVCSSFTLNYEWTWKFRVSNSAHYENEVHFCSCVRDCLHDKKKLWWIPWWKQTKEALWNEFMSREISLITSDGSFLLARSGRGSLCCASSATAFSSCKMRLIVHKRAWSGGFAIAIELVRSESPWKLASSFRKIRSPAMHKFLIAWDAHVNLCCRHQARKIFHPNSGEKKFLKRNTLALRKHLCMNI
jgi:hypothetical protein